MSLGWLGVGYALASLGPCLILLARDLSTAREELSWVSSGYGIGLLVLGLAGGFLLRGGGRSFLRFSTACLALGAALLGAAPSLHPAQAGALLLGFGAAGIVLVTPVLLAGAGAGRMARAVGFASVSGILAPLLISAVDGVSGHGRLALVLVVPPLLWTALRPIAAVQGTRETAPVAAAVPRRWLAAWRAARWWLAIVCAVSPEFALAVWGAARLQDAGLSPAAASAGASAFQLGMAAGRLLSSRLAGRIPLLGSGVALAAAGIAACAAPLHPAWVALATLLAGMGLGPLYPVLIDQLVRTPSLAPRHAAAVGALATGTSMLVGPLLLNGIAAHVSLRLGFLAAVPPVLLVAVLYGLGRIRAGEERG